METDRNQFKKHIDVVVGDTEILLIDIGQNAEVECQSMEHTPDVYKVLEPIETVAHQDDIEVSHRLQQRNVSYKYRGVLSAFLFEIIKPRDG
jgi:hypothetical protein